MVFIKIACNSLQTQLLLMIGFMLCPFSINTWNHYENNFHFQSTQVQILPVATST